jgi:MSHA biogenesis protein MshJ
MRAAFINFKSRFNAFSLRERAMIAGAALVLLVFAWDRALMNPLRADETQLRAELANTQQALAAVSAAIQGRAEDNALVAAIKQRQLLTESLAAADRELESTSAGLIAPERMLAVLRDVLQTQSGLRLVSMRNLPVTSLVPPPPNANGTPTGPPMQGPYVHALEMVVEGSYLDVLRYLQKVEGLPWRFYWQVLELKTDAYPMNRVRIRLNTLSMDKEWLGV